MSPILPLREEEPAAAEERPLHTPDPSVLEQSFSEGFQAAPSVSLDLKPPASEVLLEFDPLANQEEAAAREAWESAEGHPPPPRTPSPTPPVPPLKDDPASSQHQLDAPQPLTPSSSVFPSFSALARTFALPIRSKSRSRPGSMDVARGVPSPSTLSAFVEQQNQPQQNQPPQNQDQSTQSAASASETTTSGRSTPGTTSSEASKGDPPFDFQKVSGSDEVEERRDCCEISQIVRGHAICVGPAINLITASFLSNFAKRTFTVSDQVKIINDFLNFIVKPMRESDIWKNASDAEFENALEGMEKLVMNQLYQFTFTPAVAQAVPRRHITADDLERDRVLTQRIALFGWIRESHLDIPVGEGSNGFLMFAQQELLKVNHYKAPRDKLICILNCCKVIFGLIRHLKKEEGADSFVPILIYVVLKANPEHLLSNVECVMSIMMGAVSFIETMDHTSLSNITQEEFERNVEEALQSLPPDSPVVPHVTPVTPTAPSTPQRPVSASSSSHEGEESAQPLAISTPVQTLTDDARRLFQKTGDTISKPLNALGRIFNEALDSAEGKMQYLPGPFAPFELGRENRAQTHQGQGPPPNVPHWSHPDAARQQQQGQPNYYYGGAVPQTPAGEAGYMPPIQTPYKQRVRRVPSASSQSLLATPPGTPGYSPAYHQGPPDETPSRVPPGAALTPPRLQSLAIGTGAGIQAQIDSAHGHAAQAAKETLLQIFPSVEPEIVQWVLDANEGDLGKSIETLLEMSSGE
ncbi:Vacuolar protein sorting-associated protein 9a [Mycena venus]|uniref:Vacuolar protein sorting-associated protein 9a n=1 Tax=Mycena venus TaxID=2733690 RepID=A0A8H6YD02_9AGAR|nr:Vacuolar protein sorting-associated protein 9a [Mycena venus]